MAQILSNNFAAGLKSMLHDFRHQTTHHSEGRGVDNEHYHQCTYFARVSEEITGVDGDNLGKGKGYIKWVLEFTNSSTSSASSTSSTYPYGSSSYLSTTYWNEAKFDEDGDEIEIYNPTSSTIPVDNLVEIIQYSAGVYVVNAAAGGGEGSAYTICDACSPTSMGNVAPQELTITIGTMYAFTGIISGIPDTGDIYSVDDNHYSVVSTRSFDGATFFYVTGDVDPPSTGTLTKVSGGGDAEIVYTQWVKKTGFNSTNCGANCAPDISGTFILKQGDAWPYRPSGSVHLFSYWTWHCDLPSTQCTMKYLVANIGYEFDPNDNNRVVDYFVEVMVTDMLGNPDPVYAEEAPLWTLDYDSGHIYHCWRIQSTGPIHCYDFDSWALPTTTDNDFYLKCSNISPCILYAEPISITSGGGGGSIDTSHFLRDDRDNVMLDSHSFYTDGKITCGELELIGSSYILSIQNGKLCVTYGGVTKQIATTDDVSGSETDPVAMGKLNSILTGSGYAYADNGTLSLRSGTGSGGDTYWNRSNGGIITPATSGDGISIGSIYSTGGGLWPTTLTHAAPGYINPYLVFGWQGAFRAGGLGSTGNWNADSVGVCSFGAGFGGVASGYGSNFLGIDNTATDWATVAIGNTNQATAYSAVAIGDDNIASGYYSFAFGQQNLASARTSLAVGLFCQATAVDSVAYGYNCRATANTSVAVGYNVRNDLPNSVAIGASGLAEIIIQPQVVNCNGSFAIRDVVDMTYHGNHGSIFTMPHATEDINYLLPSTLPIGPQYLRCTPTNNIGVFDWVNFPFGIINGIVVGDGNGNYSGIANNSVAWNSWGTMPMTAAGDIIIGGTNGAPTRLAKSTDGKILTLVSGSPAWATAPTTGMTNPMTTAGDMIVGGTGGTPTRLGAGDNGKALIIVNNSPSWQTISTSDELVKVNSADPTAGYLVNKVEGDGKITVAADDDNHKVKISHGTAGTSTATVNPCSTFTGAFSGSTLALTLNSNPIAYDATGHVIGTGTAYEQTVNVELNNLLGFSSIVVGRVALTQQSSSAGTTAIFAATPGEYRANVYVTMAGGTSTGQCSVIMGWQDNQVIQTYPINLEYGSGNPFVQDKIFFRVGAASNITYQVQLNSPGTATYDLYIDIERLMSGSAAIPVGAITKQFVSNVSFDTNGCFTGVTKTLGYAPND